jgi:hypothetical protein
MKPDLKFNPSVVFYDLGDLCELMGAIYDVLHEMDYVRPDGSRNQELDRVAALQRIAKSRVEMLVAATSAFDSPKQWVCVTDTEANR